jgi:hypothetical protein
MRITESLDDEAVVVVDAVRIAKQIDAIRKAYGQRVFHIHLEAPETILAIRYKKKRRQKGFKEFSSYTEVLKNDTERQVESLAPLADVVIKTDRCTENDVVVRAASHPGCMVENICASSMSWSAASMVAKARAMLPRTSPESTTCWCVWAVRTPDTRSFKTQSPTLIINYRPALGLAKLGY